MRRRLLQRFTPTRVGTTSCGSASNCFLTVHPHACGDDRMEIIGDLRKVGSPPRVWGRPPHRRSLSRDRRFTPTRVGTTNGCASTNWIITVHPHACGDDYFLLSN